MTALFGRFFATVAAPRGRGAAMFAAVVALLLICVAPGRAAGLEPLTIVTATGPHVFSVEVQRTDAEREKGLMYRRFLPEDRGMLFDFKTEQTVLMWMKNTYLPLDMIFIGKNGKVVGLAQNAEPLSERIIPSGAPCLSVLEVNAGTAAKIGLKVGDAVEHALFKP